MSINSKNSGKSSSLKEKALSRLSKAFRRDDDFENVAKTLEIEIEKHEAEDPEDFDQVYSNPMFELSSNSEEILSLPPTPRNETSEEKIEEIQAEEIIEEEIISQEPLRVEINVLKPESIWKSEENNEEVFQDILKLAQVTGSNLDITQ